MSHDLIDRYKQLPDVLVHLIVWYTGAIVYRNGRYINRLRRPTAFLSRIPVPLRVGASTYVLKLLNHYDENKAGYILEYVVRECVYVTSTFVTYEKDGFDRYIHCREPILFIQRT